MSITLVYGFASSILEVLLQSNHPGCVYVIEDNHVTRKQEKGFYRKYKFISSDELPQIQSGVKQVYLGVASTASKRALAYASLSKVQHFNTPLLLHPLSVTSKTAELSEGMFADSFVSIQHRSMVGKYAYINAHSHLGHNSRVGKFSVLGGSVSLSGGSCIGDYVTIGSGVIVGNNVKIGDRSIVVAGSIVLEDIPPDSIARGNPSRIICSSLPVVRLPE